MMDIAIEEVEARFICASATGHECAGKLNPET
jgi:hypothetical protein